MSENFLLFFKKFLSSGLQNTDPVPLLGNPNENSTIPSEVPLLGDGGESSKPVVATAAAAAAAGPVVTATEEKQDKEDKDKEEGKKGLFEDK